MNVTHLTSKQLAGRWCMAEGTLANWRAQGRGPPFIRFGRRILYPLSEIERYEREHSVTGMRTAESST